MSDWRIGEAHPNYGKVQMMGSIEGEAYRWFIDKHGVISMIPLDCLERGKPLTGADKSQNGTT